MSGRNGARRGSKNCSCGTDVRFLFAALLSFLLVLYAGLRLIPPAEEPGPPADRAFVIELEIVPVEFAERRPLDLNSATAAELDRLPGIGPELARRIVAYREVHGPFAAVEDLLRVEGIGPVTLERIRDLVTVGEPGTGPPR